MKKLFLCIAALLACTVVGLAQEQSSGSLASGKPKGTKVTGHSIDSMVQPEAAPVKITPSVVKDAQKRLNDGGYEAGPVDGILGSRTHAALQKFQKDQKIEPTGNLDAHTRAALNVGGAQAIKSAPADLGRGGKAIGHNVAGGHPVEARKAAATGGKNFGKKVGQGTKSEAAKVKDKVGSGLSAIGDKISGTGEKGTNAGKATEQKTGDNADNSPNTDSRTNPQ